MQVMLRKRHGKSKTFVIFVKYRQEPLYFTVLFTDTQKFEAVDKMTTIYHN
jgi:hypothetical protein